MTYDAITLDTNIFDQYGRSLETGILSQLDQFAGGPVEFVLSEVVVQELKSHLLEHGKEAKSKLEDCLPKVRNQHLLENDSDLLALDQLVQKIDAAATVDSRLAKFLERTAGVVIEADKVSMTRVLSSYFEVAPPFEDRSDKKNEFPDAIALLSLESWANETGKKVLVVTKDKGWKLFAEESAWLDVESSLPTALSQFLDQDARAATVIRRLLDTIDSGSSLSLESTFRNLLSDAVDAMKVEAEIWSDIDLRAHRPYLHIDDYTLGRDEDGRLKFEIIRTDTGTIIANIHLVLDLTVELQVEFGSEANKSRDWVSIADEWFRSSGLMDVEVLLTVEGEFGEPVEDLHLAALSVANYPYAFDFGKVEPSFDEW